MSGAVQGARALTWQAAALVAGGAPDLTLSAAARAGAARAARDAAMVALELMGSRGILEGQPVDKLLRDAEALATPHISSDLLRVLSMDGLVDP